MSKIAMSQFRRRPLRVTMEQLLEACALVEPELSHRHPEASVAARREGGSLVLVARHPDLTASLLARLEEFQARSPAAPPTIRPRWVTSEGYRMIARGVWALQGQLLVEGFGPEAHSARSTANPPPQADGSGPSRQLPRWTPEGAAVELDAALEIGDQQRVELLQAELARKRAPEWYSRSGRFLGSLAGLVEVRTTSFGRPWGVVLKRGEPEAVAQLIGLAGWGSVGGLLLTRLGLRPSDESVLAALRLVANPAMCSLRRLLGLAPDLLRAFGNGPPLPAIRAVEVNLGDAELLVHDVPSLRNLETLRVWRATRRGLAAPYLRRASTVRLCSANAGHLAVHALRLLETPCKLRNLEIRDLACRSLLRAQLDADGWTVELQSGFGHVRSALEMAPPTVNRIRLQPGSHPRLLARLERLAARRGMLVQVEGTGVETETRVAPRGRQ